MLTLGNFWSINWTIEFVLVKYKIYATAWSLFDTLSLNVADADQITIICLLIF